MIFKPSAINSILSGMPENLQLLALYTIKQEYERWAKDDLTQEERDFQELIKGLGHSAGETMEQVALKVFNE